MQLTLVVIRSAVPDRLADFYTMLGLKFDYHQHGNGPFHYSGYAGATLLEIYPPGKGLVDTGLRIGIAVDDFDGTVKTLEEKGISFHQPPKHTEWGLMAVVADPEGRKVEISALSNRR